MPTITVAQAKERGILRNTWFLHTILTPIEWSKEKSIKWLQRHGYRHSRHRTTANYHRWNQAPEIHGADYTTNVTKNKVHLIFERY